MITFVLASFTDVLYSVRTPLNNNKMSVKKVKKANKDETTAKTVITVSCLAARSQLNPNPVEL